MRSSLVFFLFFACPLLFGTDWSDNNVIKFTPEGLSNFMGLQDYNGINIGGGFLAPAADTNCWLLTEGIRLDNDYVFSSAFVNISEGGSNSYVTLKVFDNSDGETVRKQVFYRSGSFEMNDIFLRNAVIYLEITGSDIQVFSFGMTRKELLLFNTNEFIINPSILFSGENTLDISFDINYPAYTDILIFNKYGKIVDTVCKNAFFNAGTNSIIWDPGSPPPADLRSGDYFIYFKARSLNGKTAESVKNLIFVRE